MSEKAIWEYLKTLKNGGGETTVSVAVGSTTTGAEGTNANVVNSGDDVNVILDFTIPRGNTGSKGDKGDKGNTGDAAGFGTPTASVDGNVGTPSVDITASGSDTAKVFNFAFHNLKGVKGDKGDTGDAFHIVKTYASVAAMNADYSGTDVKIGEYVMITSSVEDPDNAKVYIKGSQAYEFVVDMSGATGIKGDKGDTGATGNGIATVTKTSTSGLVDTYTITYTDGTTSNFTVTNGAKGDTGDDGNGISNAVLNQDYTLTLTFTDGTTYTTPSIRGATGAKGDTGATGNGIASIAKTGTSGLVDTYTITFTNGTTATFTVTNGAKGDTGDTGLDANIWTATANPTTPNYTFDISALTGGTGTPRVGDIVLRSYYRYTITSVGSTTVLTGQRTSIRGATGATGNGIASVTKTGTSGLVDTYTVTYTDGSTTTFTVTNGEKGDTGATGATGAAAGFGTPTASVDGNTGTPSVDITASGQDTAKVFDFAFHNLKGQKGDKGDTGSKGDKGDTFTYDDLTPAQKAEIKADLRAYYSKSESRYVTTQADEDTIPIGITGFRSTDILFVDINGLDLTEGEDYTISGTNIVLETPISATGQEVHFLALRAISITAQDYDALKGDTGPVADVLLDGTSVLDQRGYAILDNLMSTVTPKIDLSGYQTSGSVDKALYDAIVALGWQDVLES